jgi:hypothetical protein
VNLQHPSCVHIEFSWISRHSPYIPGRNPLLISEYILGVKIRFSTWILCQRTKSRTFAELILLFFVAIDFSFTLFHFFIFILILFYFFSYFPLCSLLFLTLLPLFFFSLFLPLHFLSFSSATIHCFSSQLFFCPFSSILSPWIHLLFLTVPYLSSH